MTGHICINFVNVHMNYHPEVKSDCIQPSNLSQPDKNWNWFFKSPWLPNWFRKKPMLYARSLMVTNYWNLKNESCLGKLKCLPVYLFTGTLLAHLAGLAAEIYRHTHAANVEDETCFPKLQGKILIPGIQVRRSVLGPASWTVTSQLPYTIKDVPGLCKLANASAYIR